MHHTVPVRPPRPLTEHERQIADRLLSIQFPGREGLQQQLATAHIDGLCSCGCPSIIFSVPDSVPSADVKRRIPVEAEVPDKDGVTIHILLHVQDGKLRELEFYRDDGEPIIAVPDPGGLHVFTLD